MSDYASPMSKEASRVSKLGKIALDIVNLFIDMRTMSSEFQYMWYGLDNTRACNAFMMTEDHEIELDIGEDTIILASVFPLVIRKWGEGPNEHTVLHKEIVVVAPASVKQLEYGDQGAHGSKVDIGDEMMDFMNQG